MGKILVTGATGFTGGALCRRLAEEGKQVVAFVRPSSRTAALLNMGIECRALDIRKREEVMDHFTDIEMVYHIAAAYRAEHADQDEFRQVNVEATRHLLDAAGKAKVRRFVHCSTVGVQGEIEKPPAAEEYRFKPGDHYQATKMEGELLALARFQNGLPGSVVRPVGIYGPGDTRFLKLFRPINKGMFVMIGSGRVLYHMTYIDDLVTGIILCGTRDAALGEVFTIGGPRYTTIRELVNLVAEALGKSRPKLRLPFSPVYGAAVLCDRLCRPFGIDPPLYPRRVEFFHKDRAFTIEKARRQLGYQPQVDLKEGLALTATWYRQQGWL
jgi:nucleoside-diphosphate-sugar epimerase